MTVPLEEQLWRIDEATKDKKIDTLVFIGNGCIQNKNGWKPLKKVLSDESLYEDDLSLCLILTAGFIRNNLNKLSVSLQENDIQKAAKVIPHLIEAHNFRKKISQEYHEASITGRIENEPFELNISNNLYDLMCQYTTLTITINWDSLLWNESNVKNIVQLHGRVSSKSCANKVAQSILLPMELRSDYCQFYCLHERQLKFHSEFTKITEDIEYRANALLDGEILTRIITNPNLIGNIKKIIVFGIRLNDYDIELMETMNYIKTKLKEKIEIQERDKIELLEIINPNDNDANRAAILFDGISKCIIQTYQRIIYQTRS